MHANVYCDCSIDEKRTLCGIAVRIITEKFAVRFQFSQLDVIGNPEIEAIATAMHCIRTRYPIISSIKVYTDCKPLVNFINGTCKMKKKEDIEMYALIKFYEKHFECVDYKWLKGHVAAPAHSSCIHRINFNKVDKASRKEMRKLRDNLNRRQNHA